MNQDKKNENKLNKAGKSILYTFILMVFMGILSDGSGIATVMIAVLFLSAGAAVLVLYLLKKTKVQKTGEVTPRGYTTHENHQPRKYSPAENNDRDNYRRLEQLDTFLRNGIIDKKEYAVLRERYQKYISE